jgi:hypothetical protein
MVDRALAREGQNVFEAVIGYCREYREGPRRAQP